MKNKRQTYTNPTDLILMFLFGYFKISLKSRADRALSALIASGTRFTGVKNTQEGVDLKIYSFHKKRVLRMLDGEGCLFSCTPLMGLPALFLSLSRRYGLILGLICFLMITVISERVVWEISVDGTETLKESEILSDLEKYGVRLGADIHSLDMDEICTSYLLENKALAWIRINAVGNSLKVVLLEKDIAQGEKNERPSNLVAVCDGLIYRVETLSGQRLVYGGESVMKGQILVSGLVQNEITDLEGVFIENPTYRFERSVGKVFALTEENITIEIPLKITEKQYTGEIYEKKSLIFFSKSINFSFLGRNSDNMCDIIETYKYAELWNGKILPVSIKSSLYREFEEKEITLSEEEARRLAEKELADKISSLLGDDGILLSQSLSFSFDDEAYTLGCKISCIRDIATETPLFASDK